MSPVNAMGSNVPTPLTTIQVKTNGEAITFLELLRIAARQRGFEWWVNDVLNVFSSDTTRTAAAASLAKAIRIDDLMEQNLNTVLAATPQGIRLNMDDGDGAETPAPAPAAEGAERPTTTPVTQATNFKSALLPHGTYGLKAIESWAQQAAVAAMDDAGALLDEASKQERPRKASTLTIRRIFAPLTVQAASAARTALDKDFQTFTAESLLSSLVTKGLLAARICKYYKPEVDWNTHVINEAAHRINEEYGPQHTLTLSNARERVLFIGTQFSILSTSVYSPAESATPRA
jgi:hypothetical protein